MAKATVTQATICRAVKAVIEAGLPVLRVEIDPDGTVVVTPDGSGAPQRVANDWDVTNEKA